MYQYVSICVVCNDPHLLLFQSARCISVNTISTATLAKVSGVVLNFISLLQNNEFAVDMLVCQQCIYFVSGVVQNCTLNSDL